LVGHHTKYYYGRAIKYNYKEKAQEMALSLVVALLKNAVEYNGTIPEKFDLEISSHKVFC
jgi:alpha,alpha-trehalase